jgi:hypothetical protein
MARSDTESMPREQRAKQETGGLNFALCYLLIAL